MCGYALALGLVCLCRVLMFVSLSALVLICVLLVSPWWNLMQCLFHSHMLVASELAVLGMNSLKNLCW